MDESISEENTRLQYGRAMFLQRAIKYLQGKKQSIRETVCSSRLMW